MKEAIGQEEALFSVPTYGATGDGVTVNTSPFQQAIDECSRSGGGVVHVPPGRFVIGTIELKTGITLELSPGAVLMGSTNIGDYRTDTHHNMYAGESHMDRCLIFARGATNIGIRGTGVIDGRGHRQYFPNTEDPERHRPMLIRFLECSRIRLRDVCLINPAAWTSAWLYCSDIVVDGVSIHSRANDNGDGLDFDGCTDVHVSNCTIDTSDDSICLQTSRPDRPCQNLVITNCNFTSRWAGIRVGLLSRGDFSDIVVSNCIFRDIEDSGLKIQMCEGATMRNLLFSNLVMDNVPRPVFMSLSSQRACVDAPEGPPAFGMIGDIVFSTIRIAANGDAARSADHCIVLSGYPGHPLRNIFMRDITYTSPGGGSFAQPSTVLREFEFVEEGSDEIPWPEYSRLGGTVPARGIYARHVEHLSIVDCSFDSLSPDSRPAVYFDDCADLDVRDIR